MAWTGSTCQLLASSPPSAQTATTASPAPSGETWRRGRKLPPCTYVIFLLMESNITAATWPSWPIYSFIDPAGRKHNCQALRCLFSRHISRLQPSGTSLWDEQMHHLAAGPRALPGQSVLPLQVLRVISCSAQGARTSGRQEWVQCPLTGFPQLFSECQGTCQGSPLKLLPLSIPLWRADAVLGDTWSEPGKTVLHVGPSLSGALGTSNVGL